MNRISLSRHFLGLSACLLLLSPLRASTIGNLQYWANPEVNDGPGGTQAALGAQNRPIDQTKYYAAAPTIGQVITAPSTDSVLSSFTVTSVAVPPGTGLNFSAAVYYWDPVAFRPAGNALTIDRMSNPPLNGATKYLVNFADLTFFPNVQLLPSQQYVVLFTTLGLPQPLPYSVTSFGVTPTDTYAGGEMVFASIGTLNEQSTALTSITSERWGNSNTCDESNLSSLCTKGSSYSAFGEFVAPDMAFSATFNPAVPDSTAPEPTSTVCLSVGLILLAMAGRMCKRPGGAARRLTVLNGATQHGHKQTSHPQFIARASHSVD